MTKTVFIFICFIIQFYSIFYFYQFLGKGIWYIIPTIIILSITCFINFIFFVKEIDYFINLEEND